VKLRKFLDEHDLSINQASMRLDLSHRVISRILDEEDQSSPTLINAMRVHFGTDREVGLEEMLSRKKVRSIIHSYDKKLLGD